jgi:CheY-like chemotaxis protein
MKRVNSMSGKVVFLRILDEEALTVLRDFLEPLGYRVEFAADAKKEPKSLDSVKDGSASRVAFAD